MMLARSVNSGLHRFYRNIYQCSVRFINHEGDTYYKSNLNLLTKEDDGHTYVEAFSPIGFRLSSGLRILGPCVLFPKTVLHWNVASSESINEESLSLFSILDPKPDILLIGIGNRGSTYDKNIIRFLRSKQISVEILPTDQACSTFNFLNAERRVVAAALIPPAYVRGSDDTVMIEDDVDDAMTKEAEMKTIEHTIDKNISKTMKSFQDDGVLRTIYKRDRQREKRDKEERENEMEKNDRDDKR